MKQKIRSNYRVVVETPEWRVPGRDNDDTHKAMMSDSQELESQIKRHVDCEITEVKFDTEYTCSHCGYNWEVDEEGLPVCCDKAQREHMNEQ